MMEYILKTSAVIFIFYCSYKLFLQGETFFNTNRWYLLSGLIVATIIPLITIPVYIEYMPNNFENLTALNSDIIIAQNDKGLDFWHLVSYTYGLGVLFFLGKLITELISLKLLFNKHHYYKHNSFSLVETRNDIPPFSFFNWIVYNPNKYSKEELKHIINHEKVHAKELHSVDIILIQIACVVFWLNPFIWLYKKEIQQNLEFIADKKAQEFSDCKKSYQLVLLKSSLPEHKFLITNNFYNSQIKKRIIMLHKSKSHKLSGWKYALILPVLALFLMSFNTKNVFIEIDNPSDNLKQLIHTKTEADLNEFYNSITDKTESTIPEKNPTTDSLNRNHNNLAQAKIKNATKKINIDSETLITVITKYTTDSELDIIKNNLKTEGLTVKFKNIKRNKNGEITAIKIDGRSDVSNAHYNMSSDEAIASIKIVFDKENKSISIGNSETLDNHNTHTYSTKSEYHKIHNSGNGSHVYVHSNYHDDEHHDDDNVLNGTNILKGKTKFINSNDNRVYVTSDYNDNKVVEMILDNGTEETQKETIIINGKVKKSFEINDDKHEEIIFQKNADRIYISGNDNKNPLYIIDGKEVSKDMLIELKPDSIESIEVLKGKHATEAYGDKGKDGVIVIKTKKKS